MAGPDDTFRNRTVLATTSMPPRIRMPPMRAAMPVTALTLTLAASFAILVRVLSSAYVEGWSGFAAGALVTAAVAAFALHSWALCTGRGWKASLQTGGRTDRLAALDRLLADGRIQRNDYLDERRRLLRGP